MIHTREAVIRAIEECDRLGRDRFLEKYGFRRAERYVLLHDGKHYDSKAIVGVAYGYENPGQGPLRSSDFSGGASTVQGWLEQLGFEFTNLGSVSTAKTRPLRTQSRPIQTMPLDVASGSVAELCHTLHQWFKRMSIFDFPLTLDQIPPNGIYVLFENGEHGHGTNRIVRTGTHTGNNQLRSRLTQHFVNENKDRSIFRKNLGRCLLNQDNDPFLDHWELDLTTRAEKDAHASHIDFDKQNEVEEQVSEYMRSHFSFVAFEVPQKDKRLILESRITSTVSLCDGCCPSSDWLGLHSPKQKIRESGLWQVNELYKMPFSVDELLEFSKYLSAK